MTQDVTKTTSLKFQKKPIWVDPKNDLRLNVAQYWFEIISIGIERSHFLFLINVS